MTLHIYNVHPVDCQPQWPANDNESKVRKEVYAAMACLAVSAGVVVLVIVKLVGFL